MAESETYQEQIKGNQTAFSIYLDKNGNTVCIQRSKVPDTALWDSSEDLPEDAPREARVQRLDYIDVGEHPKVMILGGLHGDETQSPEIFMKLFNSITVPSTIASNVHILAAFLDLRSWIRPVQNTESFDSLPKGYKALIVQQQLNIPDTQTTNPQTMGYRDILDDPPLYPAQSEKDISEPYPGVAENLNRQFDIPLGDIITLHDVMQKIDYPEAKLLIEYLKLHPDTNVCFAIHEENTKGAIDKLTGDDRFVLNPKDGFYFYYASAFSEGNDPYKEFVESLREKLIGALQEKGYAIFDGIDDPNDPDLNLPAKKGMIYEPMKYNENNIPLTDKTFEGLLNACTARGVLIDKESDKKVQVQSSFSFEIPKYLSPERKQRMLEIIRDEFISPYIEMTDTIQPPEKNLQTS